MLVSILTLCAAPARAQGEPSVPPEYEAEISTAVDEHEAGQFESARTHFLRAHELLPSARTLRGLGKVEFELHDYAAAARYLEEALASPVRPLPDELREEVAELLARALASTAVIAVSVKPESARVSIDGAPASIAANGQLCINEGEHVLEVRASGYLTERRQLSARAGERSALQITLVEPELAARHSEPVAQREPSRPVYRQWWFWTLTGVAAAGVTATAVVLATRDQHPQPRVDGTFANP